MPDIAIRVENLSKKFRVGTGGGPSYHRVTELLNGLPKYAWQTASHAFRRSIQSVSPRPASGSDSGGEGADGAALSPSEFWALKDISFEVRQGEVVGIIGRNGAGKSTLLKILSRVTEPTSGRFGVRGRVASLLEVGTGFHPELTGRENIYVSGITLGMTRAEVRKRFDEIVDFSGVEKFLDTPVKRYSSGMQVRLGFAVAAHLESEILIVDEVLAVGDAEFQRKCLQKMSAVAGRGRTVLFVSHNLAAVEQLCSQSLILQTGSCLTAGPTPEVLDEYSQTIDVPVTGMLKGDERRSGDGRCRIRGLSIFDSRGFETRSVHPSSSFELVFDVENLTDQPLDKVSLGYSIINHLAVTVVVCYSDYEDTLFCLRPGNNKLAVRVSQLPVEPGEYSIDARILCQNVESDWPRYRVGHLNVLSSKDTEAANAQHSGRGILLVSNVWRSSS